MIVPPISVLLVGRSESSRNAQTGTSTISVWANTVICRGRDAARGDVEDQRAADDEHRPVHEGQPDVRAPGGTSVLLSAIVTVAQITIISTP